MTKICWPSWMRGSSIFSICFAQYFSQSVSSNEGRSTATVELEKDSVTYPIRPQEDGPCDAAFRAIDRITGVPGTIVDFSVHTEGPGTDGRAEVRVRARFQEGEFSGKVYQHNIVEAAARSYLQAANKAAYEMKRMDDGHRSGTGSVHKNEAVDRLIPGGF